MPNRATKPATPAAVADLAAGRKSSGYRDGAATVRSGAAAEDRPQMPPGTMVSDRYRIASVLGEGGMGVVYAAEHVLMRKEVALKVLHAEMCTDPEVVARFEREAIAAAHIDHPNVAAATDFGRLPDGACYLVLELVRGRSLRDELRDGPLPLVRALHILRGISAGVAAAHAKGIVHRDLKPENVMLVDRDGSSHFVKVLDFGIAKVDTSVAAAPQAGTSKVLTRVGSVFGTPEYMAPEQAVGDVVDARADIYALGVVLLEMLTGKCPFVGKPLSILRERILSTGPPDLSGVTDPAVRALLEKLLAREPAHRMQTADELVATLDAILAEIEGEPGQRASPALPVVPPAPVIAEAVVRPARAKTRKTWWLAALLVAGLGASAMGYALVRAATAPGAEAEAEDEGAETSTPVGLPAFVAPSEPSEPSEPSDLIEPNESVLEIDLPAESSSVEAAAVEPAAPEPAASTPPAPTVATPPPATRPAPAVKAGGKPQRTKPKRGGAAAAKKTTKKKKK